MASLSMLPTYAHLLVSAVAPIYAGAHASLSRPQSALKPDKKRKRKEDGDDSDADTDDDEEDQQRMEGLSTSDALVFPILAGLTLSGMYLVITWLQDPALLNKILGWYFAIFSVFTVGRLVSDGLDVAHSIIYPNVYSSKGRIYSIDETRQLAVAAGSSQNTSPLAGMLGRVPLPASVLVLLWADRAMPRRKIRVSVTGAGGRGSFRFGFHQTLGLAVGISVVLWYNVVGKPWWMTNIMGFAFAYSTLQLLSPTTFLTGSLVLGGLFFYDIYFVFFTPIMVTVAKSLDIPVKLLFPRPSPPDADPAVQSLSMLGLGDIVLPGIFIGLALRFDLFLHYKSKERPTVYVSTAGAWGDNFWTVLSRVTGAASYTPRNAFAKPYFHVCLVGYVLGMLQTLLAMTVSDHAQPALLYLVPNILAWFWLTAWWRGDWHKAWQFSDAADEEAKDGQAAAGTKSESTAKGKGQKDSEAKDETKEAASNSKGSTVAASVESGRPHKTLLALRIELLAHRPRKPAQAEHAHLAEHAHAE